MSEGFTLGMLVLLVVFLVGAIGVAALTQAAVAVLILGPRRWEVMTLPAGAAAVAMIGYLVFLGRGPDSPILGSLIVGTLAAFLVAGLQRGPLEAGETPGHRAARVIRIGGGILAWMLAGLAVGLVVGAAVQGALPLLVFPLIGLLIAIRPSVVREQAPAGAATEPPAVPDAPPPAGMLDE